MYSLTVLDLSLGVFYGNISCQVTMGGIQNQINEQIQRNFLYVSLEMEWVYSGT